MRVVLSDLRRLLHGVEASLLGFELPPVSRELAGWQADPPGAWCLRCGSGRPLESRSSRGCPECRARRLPYEGLIRLGSYRPPLDGWIRAVKGRRWPAMAEALGDLLGERCRALPGLPTFDAVVPVPTPWLRRAWRGIDHSGVLAARVARALGRPVRCPLRQREGPTQVGQSRTDRLRRGNPFVARGPVARVLGDDRTLLLVDDVRSTGSTLRQAARALRAIDAGVLVWGAVVAVADLGPEPGTPGEIPDPSGGLASEGWTV